MFVNQKGFTPIIFIFLGLILITTVGVGGYYLGKSHYSQPKEASTTPTTSSTPIMAQPTSSVPDDWITYTQDSFDFTFKHPPVGYRVEQQEGVYATARFCDYTYETPNFCGIPAPDEFIVEIDRLEPGQTLESWIDWAHEYKTYSIFYKEADPFWKDPKAKKEWSSYLGYSALNYQMVMDKEAIEKYSPIKVTDELLKGNEGDESWAIYKENVALKYFGYVFIKGDKVYTVAKVITDYSKQDIDNIFNSFRFIR